MKPLSKEQAKQSGQNIGECTICPLKFQTFHGGPLYPLSPPLSYTLYGCVMLHYTPLWEYLIFIGSFSSLVFISEVRLLCAQKFLYLPSSKSFYDIFAQYILWMYMVFIFSIPLSELPLPPHLNLFDTLL